jgi:glycosyltransferase involved in cell wall biosynthesis
MARLRVLHVIQNLNYGGMERLFADLVRLLDPERFESHVMYVNYLGRFGEGLERYAAIHQAVPLPRWSMLHPGPLVRQIAAIKPDVMHTHSGVWYKFSLAARQAGVPRLVHTEHGRKFPDPWLDRLIARLASRRTDVVVAVSEVLARHLRDDVVSHPDRVVLVPNGVDTELHRPRPDDGALRQELGLSAEVPVIGSIGRLEPIKGYDIMVEAFAQLRKQWSGGVPPVLVVGGEGSDRGHLEQLIQAHGLQGQVHLLGWRDDVDHMQSAFAFFTMTSRSEGTSVSLLEAMSAGLTPIVTNVGGNAAVLGDVLRHRLMTPGDVPAIAAGWAAALGDRAKLRADSMIARRRVEDDFSLKAMVRAYEALYSATPAITREGA